MKKFRWLAVLPALVLALLGGFLWLCRDLPAGTPLLPLWQMARQVRQIEHLTASARQGLSVPLDQAQIDQLETLLAEAGFAVVDTDAVYPAYLANPQGLRRFWEQTSSGESAAQTIFRIQDSGISCLRFLRSRGENCCLTARLGWQADGSPLWRDVQCLPLYDMALVQDNTFYYRLYPAGDPHYIDYAQLRLTPPDRELEDLCQKYVSCVGYRFVNLFLVSWQEGDWGQLSFPDLFEYLYPLRQGRDIRLDQFPPEGNGVYRVPAAILEDAICPFFQISLEEFRQKCPHIEDDYLWKAVHGNDVTSWKLPLFLPEVTSCVKNPDGTMTLSVQVRCPEYKTNDLFTHEVTIRPTPAGFQYVANRVTSGWEALPPSGSRASLFGVDGQFLV